MTAPRAVDGDGGTGDGFVLRHLAATIWSELPLLLAIDLALLAGALPPLLLVASGLAPLAPLAAALTLAPLWMAAVAAADRLLAGEAVPVRSFAGLVLRFGRSGSAAALVPALPLTALLGTLAILGADPGRRWLLVPLFVDASATVLALLGALAAFPLIVRTGLRGRPLWVRALAAVAGSPLRTAATVAVVVLAWGAGQAVGPLVPVLLAAPFAIWVAAMQRPR